jgi:REP element-mobilizing transposase RayT
MPSAWTQCFYHIVLSTRQRMNWIKPEIEPRIHQYIGGIVREKGCTILAIHGMPDHVHLLVQLRADLSLSDLVRHIKGRSSKWINEEFKPMPRFAWQEGYGGFTVSKSAVPAVKKYIEGQKERHKRQDFKVEFMELLRKHGIDCIESEVFG